MEVDGDEIANIVENTVEEDETTTGVLPDSKRQKAMSKRSWIWAHFETLPLGIDKIPREKCKYCGQIYQNRSENGTGSTYPTANLYFLQVANCYVVLREKADDDNDYIKNMARQMLPKFEKYWSDFSMILSIAVVFDPRYKLQFVDYIYNQIYGYCNSISYQNVKKNLFELFCGYSKGGSISSQVSSSKSVRVDTSTNPNNDIPTRKEKSTLFKNFNAFGGNSAPPKSQLELYLEEPRLDSEENSDLDVLAHWKSYQYRYPEVAAMARDLLSIPVTTVASEAAFSVGGRVLDQYRTQLLPSTVEAIVCTRDWICAEKDKPCEEFAEDIASELTTEAGTQNSNNMVVLSNQDAN